MKLDWLRLLELMRLSSMKSYNLKELNSSSVVSLNGLLKMRLKDWKQKSSVCIPMKMVHNLRRVSFRTEGELLRIVKSMGKMMGNGNVVE